MKVGTETYKASASRLYLDILFQTLKRHGIEKSRFIDQCGLGKRVEIEASNRLPVSDIVHYWSKAIELTQCQTLGLEAGLNIHPSDYGIMSHVWMNCESLREVAELTTHYKHLMNNAFHAEMSQTDKGITTLSLEFSGHNLRESSALIELDFASVLHLGHFLTESTKKKEVKFKEVHFKHKPNASICLYEDSLACPVKFNQASNLIMIDNATLDLPVHSPNTVLRDSMVKMVDKLVLLELGDSRLADQVSYYIDQHLSEGIPDANKAAKHFGSSLSTFKRRLQKENTNYLELVNYVRQNKAKKMLKQRQFSLGEIAFRLDFANVSAFHRAFKRWFDLTPKQYQKNLQK